MIPLATLTDDVPAQGLAVVLITLGIGCILGGLLRGQVKVGGLEFPTLEKGQRWTVGIAGAVLVFIGADLMLGGPFTPGSRSHTTVLTFDQAPTQAPPGYVPANDYLEQYGVTISDVSQGDVVIYNEAAAYNGVAFRATSSPNVLTQINCAGKPENFTLKLKTEAKRITFRRAGLIAPEKSGVTHPAWRADALGRDGRVLTSAHEQLILNVGKYNHAEFRDFVLEAPGISAVRFSSDYLYRGRPFAAFCGVLIDDLTITF